MNTALPRRTHRTAKVAEQVMRRAVRDEIEKKAKLGQYVIISRDGKPRRVPAAEALLEIREAESAGEASAGADDPVAAARRRSIRPGTGQ